MCCPEPTVRAATSTNVVEYLAPAVWDTLLSAGHDGFCMIEVYVERTTGGRRFLSTGAL